MNWMAAHPQRVCNQRAGGGPPAWFMSQLLTVLLTIVGGVTCLTLKQALTDSSEVEYSLPLEPVASFRGRSSSHAM
jgi:hypothetical protein